MSFTGNARVCRPLIESIGKSIFGRSAAQVAHSGPQPIAACARKIHDACLHLIAAETTARWALLPLGLTGSYPPESKLAPVFGHFCACELSLKCPYLGQSDRKKA